MTQFQKIPLGKHLTEMVWENSYSSDQTNSALLSQANSPKAQKVSLLTNFEQRLITSQGYLVYYWIK